MFEGFESFDIITQQDPQVSIHGRKSSSTSSLPPLLLLHGFPQTHHIWHRVVPHLTDQYTIVLLDIRGYGSSSKPGDVSAYAKSAMARDCVTVMQELGYVSFFVCAHDRGARVAHKMCVDYPDRIRKAILLDISPTLSMYTSTSFDFAKAYYHWFFLIQEEPLPETLISGSPRKFTELLLGGRQGDKLAIFDAECLEEYIKVMEDPAAVHSLCNDYRASSTLDLEEARDDLSNGRLIQCPLRVLWGKYGVIEKCFDPLGDWRAVTKDGVPVDGNSVESGHYIPEQVPDDVVENIRGFLV